jgi:nucleotide-binding universal stress UspA family protein
LESDKATAVHYLDQIAAKLKKKSITVTTEVRLIIQEGRAADEIIDFAGQIRADLVAMSTHGRSGVRRWVFASVAERILREGNIPLLLVKPQPSL